MSKNIDNHNKDRQASVLRSIAKVGIPLIGVWLLSNLTIFTSRHFLTPGLTKEQLDLMDKHNADHHKTDSVHILGRGLAAGLAAISSDAPAEIESASQKGLAEMNEALDSDVASLPKKLAHKHIS